MKKVSEFFRLIDTLPPLVFSLMVLSVVAMNLLANKSIDTGLTWLALDCGILFSWLCFLAMDIMTHCYGPKAATAGRLAAMGINLLMCSGFFVASRLGGVWGESFVTGSEQIINTALDNTFGGTWFVLLGSSVAFAVSAVCNNFLNWAIGQKRTDNSFGTFALRSYVSTFIGQFVDNMVFASLVFMLFAPIYWGGFSWTLPQCITCSLIGAFLELVMEVVFSPIGYGVARRWRRLEVGGAYLQAHAA